jgi:putative methionine-R-sulfoxide reductase with GAF domain
VTRHHRQSEPERLRRDARIAGLRDFQTPSLEAVEQRRRQLWQRTATALALIAALVVAFAIVPSDRLAEAGTGRILFAIVGVGGGLFLWAFHKETALERLTRSLTDERVLTAALTNRLHEVSLLLDAGKQMNAHLQMDELLDTILRSACELLDATGGSVMLVEETDLVTVCALGRDAAVGQRMRLGDGVAGYVAIRRDPVLIDGHADPELFPGLVLREPYVESAMSVPLVHRAELQGVLNVNAPIGRSFTEYDLRALAVFAEQAALAIANARLYEAERAHVAALLDLRKRREVG